MAHGIPTGVLRYDQSAVCPGYTLIPANFSGNTYLINMEGELVHTWKSTYPPGPYAQLLPDGTLLRGTRLPEQGVRFPGAGGGFQRLDWDSRVLQEFQLNDVPERVCMSHGFCALPNGNVLVTKRMRRSADEAYARGRIPGTLPAEGYVQGELVHDGIYTDVICEVTPDNEIVREWAIWDHIGDGELEFSINYTLPPTTGYYAHVNWIQINAVDYSPATDQMLLCSRNFGEIFIVNRADGNVVWRWGNPSTHGRGTGPSFCDNGAQQLFGPHCAHFLDNGHILLLDNGWMRPQGNRSRVLEVVPFTGEIVWEYRSQFAFNFATPYQGGCQRLPNGNTLITAAGSGQVFEVTGGPNPRVVWEFVSPWIYGGTTNYLDDMHASNSPMGEVLIEGHMQNMVHRAYRYTPDYPGLRNAPLSQPRPIAPDMVRVWETEPWKSGTERARTMTPFHLSHARRNTVPDTDV